LTPSSGYSLAVRNQRAETTAEPVEDDEPEFAPFSVELGEAVAVPSGYALTALRTENEGTHALVATLAADAASGTELDLGRVYGNVEPPALAASRDGLLVAAVADSNPNGRRLQLVRIDDAAAKRFTRGAEIEPPRGETDLFDLEVGDGGGVVVWDEAAPKTDSSIRGSTFSVQQLQLSPVATLSPPDVPAEAPRVVRRPGGFWLAFIARPRTPSRGSGSERTPAPPREPETSEVLVDLGPRRLALIPLDASAKPIGSPLFVGSPEARVLSYDVTTLADGTALLAFRNDSSTPGAEGGAVEWAVARPDGTLAHHVVDSGELAAGGPTLLGGNSGAWLAVSSGERTELAALHADRGHVTPLHAESVVKNAEPLAATGDRLLLARPRGLGAEFLTVACRATPTAKK
jgi:hypothetical protein